TAFQERHDTTIKFASLPEWQSCYPFGTGLCTLTFLLKEYNNLARRGKFTLQGRKANLLTSGEDTQMVLLCIYNGYFAGVSPTLKIRHIIPEARANYQYLKKLAYGTGMAYETSMLQVFPEYSEKLQAGLLSRSKFTRRVIKKYVAAKMSADPFKVLELTNFIAANASAYVALDKPIPPLVKKIIQELNLV
nr:hypothetical protein [Bacteroidota bacterium]